MTAPLLLLLALHGHSFEAKRSILIEADGDTLYVVARIKASKEAAIIGRGLKQALIQRALSGLKLYVGSSTVALQDVQSKLQKRELMLLGKVVLSANSVELATSGSGDPVELIVVPGKRSVVKTSRGKLRRGGFRAQLGLSDRVRWIYRK